MEIKKSKEADLEPKRRGFFWIGMVFSLSLVLLAFEYGKHDKKTSQLGDLNLDLMEEEIVPISQVTPPPPPPPPKPTTVIEIVDDEEEIEEELEVVDLEVDEDFEVEIVEMEEEVEEEQIFTVVEQMPEFPGGVNALMKYLGEKIDYPQMAVDAGITGKVYVQFVVDKDGKVKNARVAKGIGGGCDEEALRVVKDMPAWSPGKQRGKTVKVQYTLPVNFTLR